MPNNTQIPRNDSHLNGAIIMNTTEPSTSDSVTLRRRQTGLFGLVTLVVGAILCGGCTPAQSNNRAPQPTPNPVETTYTTPRATPPRTAPPRTTTPRQTHPQQPPPPTRTISPPPEPSGSVPQALAGSWNGGRGDSSSYWWDIGADGSYQLVNDDLGWQEQGWLDAQGDTLTFHPQGSSSFTVDWSMSSLYGMDVLYLSGDWSFVRA
jgi:hypothetical protein